MSKILVPLINKHNFYIDSPSDKLTNAIQLSNRVLALPIYPDLSEDNVKNIIKIIKDNL